MKKFALPVLLLSLFATSANAASQAEIDKYFQIDQQAYRKDNAVISGIGLNAPVKVDNAYDWALKYVDANANAIDFSQKLSKFPDRIILNGDTKQLHCLLNLGWNNELLKADTSPCYTKEQFVQTLAANKLLLKRFREFAKMPRFIDIPPHAFLAGDILGAERLYMIDLTFKTETDREDALKEWMAFMGNLRNWNADQSNWAQRAVLLVAYNTALRQLPSILGTDRALTAKYLPQLSEILKPFGAKDMNVELLVKTDHQLFGSVPKDFGFDQKLYDLDQDLIELSKVPPPEYPAANEAFTKKYADLQPEVQDSKDLTTEEKQLIVKLFSGLARNGHHELTAKELKLLQSKKDVISTPLGNSVVKEIAVVSGMIGTMNTFDAGTRAYALYVNIKAKNIPAGKIAAFIKTAPPEMQNPLTGKPFDYDAKKKEISFDCHLKEIQQCTLSLN